MRESLKNLKMNIPLIGKEREKNRLITNKIVIISFMFNSNVILSLIRRSDINNLWINNLSCKYKARKNYSEIVLSFFKINQ